MSRRQAFTLSEMLVYMGVLMVFSTAVYAVFTLSLRLFFMSQARSEGLQSGLMAVSLMKGYLARGAASTVQTQSSPNPACMFLSAQSPSTLFATDSQGKIYWQSWMCIYLDSSQNLRISEQALVGGPNVSIPAAPTFSAMTALNSRVLAGNVVSASFQMSGKTLSYQIVTQAKASVSNGQLSGGTLTGQFAMRN